MTKVRKIISSPFFLGGLAVVFLSLAVILVGDLLALGQWRPFRTLTGQLLFIGAITFVWLALFGMWLWRVRRKNRKLVEDISNPELDGVSLAISDEEAALNSKFSEALKSLSKMRFRSRMGGSKYLYQLPWYIFIGPPGAGKTTALENCGLEFPLQKRGAGISIDGGSGTRNCDWIFTNDAVFIDTAGRYTTQENLAVDSHAWDWFLNLLLRHRPHEPINGVIVAISLSDLAVASQSEVDQHAEAIRDRLNELSNKMKVRVPVYVLFTKADLLVGFNEFFQTYRKNEREQVWGVTFPLRGQVERSKRLADDLQQVEQEYDLLTSRIGELQFKTIQNEPDIDTRTRIFGFSSQFASLKPVVSRFLAEAFRTDNYGSAPQLLRGFYFTSATQIGQPVDRLLSNMSREFGLERRTVGILSNVGSKAYFLEQLLRSVVFPEAGLVSGRGRRNYITSAGKYAALAACIVLPVGLALGWWSVHSHVKEQVSHFRTEIANFEADLSSIDVSPVKDDDLYSVLQPLNRLRNELRRLESPDAAAPLWGLGLDDTKTVRAQAKLAYEKALDDLFRPRLLYRMEYLLNQNIRQPEPLFEILKAYLILGGRGPRELDSVRDFIHVSWENGQYPAKTNADILPDLKSHLDALLETRLADRDLDDELIGKARAEASHVTLEERALRLLMRSKEAQSLTDWSVAEIDAATTSAVFANISGAPLDDPIPGIFTYKGFYQVFNPNLDAAAIEALGEEWVLSKADVSEDIDRDQAIRIRERIRGLYYKRYAAEWNDVLNDLQIVPFASSANAAEVLSFLSSPQSPLRIVLQDIVKNTSLTEQPDENSALLNDVKKIGFHRVSSKFSTLARLLSTSSEKRTSTEPEGSKVQKEFSYLSDFVGDERSGSDLEAVLNELRDLYNVVDDLQQEGQAGMLILSEQPSAKRAIRIVERSAPIPVAKMIKRMIQNAGDTTNVGVLSQLNEIWQSTVYKECRRKIQGRYPFGGGRDLAIGDFTAVLGPGGAIDKFYNERLSPLVNDDVKPWRWRKNIGIPAERLAFFETTQELKDAFFPIGTVSNPELRLRVFSEAMSQGVKVAKLSIGGLEASFQQGKAAAAQLAWPGPSPANGAEVGIVVDDIDESGFSELQELRSGELGDWGLFHLIDKSEFKISGAGDTARIAFGGGGQRVMLEFRMENAINPLSMRRSMQAFRCPPKL